MSGGAGTSKAARRLWKGPSAASGFSLGVPAQQLLSDAATEASASSAGETDGGASDAERAAEEEMEAVEDLLETAAAMAAAQDPVSALSRCSPWGCPLCDDTL